jgi:hypothetical protein
MKKIYEAKSPGETLKYGFNWSPKNLGTERIIVADATVQEGTVVVLQTSVEDVPNARDGQGVMYTITGGANGEMAKILLEIETDAGSKAQQTVYLPVRQK